MRVAVAFFGHPGGVAELDGHRVLAEALLRVEDVLAVVCARTEPRRELEEHRPELAGAVERQQRFVEPPPDLVQDLVRQVLRVEVRLLLDLGRKRLPQVLRERLDRCRVAGERRVGLDVEHEVGGSALDPGLGVAFLRDGVVGAVDLDDRETARRRNEGGLRASWRTVGTSRYRSASYPPTNKTLQECGRS